MKSIIVTGNHGEIGKEIKKHLNSCGYKVIGIDKDNQENDQNIKFDLDNLQSNKSCIKLKKELFKRISNDDCIALINNAAVQILSNLEDLDISDFRKSMSVNVEAPLILSKMLLPKLKESKGNIINIGSIHINLTKPSYLSYATSKAALLGLTKSMAVEIGNKVKVNMISPAAINTKMLIDGFEGHKKKLLSLKNYHPTLELGTTSEIAKLIECIIKSDINFLNGSNITLDGGISSRLHDPV